MYSREQIEKIVGKWYDSITEYHPGDDIHVCDMLEGIQDYLLYNKPPSKFMQFCAEEKWDGAYGVADQTNRGVLKATTIYQDFVRVVGREKKLNTILKEDE